jgi:hypothetical protein
MPATVAVFDVPEPPSRPPPWSVTVVSILLVIVGLVAAMLGIAATAMDGCCGSREPGDTTPTLVGIGVGGATILSAVLLWVGRTSRWPVLAAAAAVPVACLVAAGSSSDLAAAAAFAVVGWCLLAVFVSRGRPAAWLSGRRDGG